MGHVLTFRGAFVRYADLRMNEAGVFSRLHLTAELTKPVMEAMGWTEPPDWIDSAKLAGTLSAQSLTLTPNQKQLKEREIQMEASEVSDFTVVRVTEDEADHIELRFIARVTQVGAIQWVEDYLRTVGQDPGALKVSYVSASAGRMCLRRCDKQEALPLEGEKDTGCIPCNNGIEYADGSTTVHASGSPCTRASVQ